MQLNLFRRWHYLPGVRQKEQSFKDKQKEFYDRRHRVRDLPALASETGVWVTSGTSQVEGRIVGQAESPRSYLVDMPSGIVRRNRLHLGVVPGNPSPPSECYQPPPTQRKIMTRLQTGTAINPPCRYPDPPDGNRDMLRGEM